jgi:hypothetical protein
MGKKCERGGIPKPLCRVRNSPGSRSCICRRNARSIWIQREEVGSLLVRTTDLFVEDLVAFVDIGDVPLFLVSTFPRPFASLVQAAENRLVYIHM